MITIAKILIANNGIAAVKEIRSIRKWSYETFGDEWSIQFTVMATSKDLKINADQYIEVPNNYIYLMGHASENPKLPESLAQSKHKMVFIGPLSSAMRSLGDKISSIIVAQSANFPTMDWSEACIKDVDDGLNKANAIRIKASEGGRGKGIRKVENPDNFKQPFAQVQGEVHGSPIFIMRLARDARHLEVQIIEEAPVTIAKQETFESMENTAVRLAKLVGYVSAGTVEHPTTEMVSGVNYLLLNYKSLCLFKPAPKGHQHECLEYFSVNSAGGLHEFADSQFGYISLWGESSTISKEYDRTLEPRWNISSKLIETQAFEDNSFTTGQRVGIHYKFTAIRSAPDSFTLYLNGSRVQVSVRWWVIKNDPTQLRSLSPGKLVRCLVESGDHVKRGDAYAEIEVNNAIVQFIKQQNSTFESGDIIGVLTLDDPNSHYGDDGYDYRTPSYDSLKALIDTRVAVFVVLPNFFYHHDSWINSATTYSPTGSGMRRSSSISDLSYLVPKTKNEPFCVGAMISCTLNEEIERNIPRILKLFPKIQTVKGWKSQDPLDRNNINNVLNIALRLEDDAIEDEALKKQHKPLIQRHSYELREHGIRRITI
ncbi:4056_t:CDS:10, partial [Funneliformis geosporum]